VGTHNSGQFLLCTLLSLCLSNIVNGGSTSQNEVERAMAALGSGSMEQLRERLFTYRITFLSAEFRAQAINALPAGVRDHRIRQGKLFHRVESAFQTALQLHGRGNIELFFVSLQNPTAQLWRGCVLVLSDSLAAELQDAELIGVMTHELGHSYFEDEMVLAQSNNDPATMRLIELKCDAVAMLSLSLLDHNPELYVRALHRIEAINRRRGRSRGLVQTHPELATRLQFAARFMSSLH
jgi:Zn-dependent protease with chaperone function